MKKIILVVACAFFIFGAKSQTNTDEIALMQASYGMDKKQILIQYMKFTEAENVSFWKEYDIYEAERKEIGKKRISNITEYANNYDKMTDVKVTELVNTSLAIQTDFTNLWKKTYAKISKVISPVRAAQFIQLEMYLETVVRMEIQTNIPMIGELDKTHK